MQPDFRVLPNSCRESAVRGNCQLQDRIGEVDAEIGSLVLATQALSWSGASVLYCDGWLAGCHGS